MRPALLALAVAIAALAAIPAIPASATAAKKTGDASYVLHGPYRVRTTSGPIAFDRTYDPELRAQVEGPDSALRIVVTGEGMKCTLQGVKKGYDVTLAPGQKCPQRVRRDGMRADLDGVLASGSAKIAGTTITLVTHWDVVGKIDLGFKKVKVRGLVDTNVKGTRT